jgi:hypothetical protein
VCHALLPILPQAQRRNSSKVKSIVVRRLLVELDSKLDGGLKAPPMARSTIGNVLLRERRVGSANLPFSSTG